jgi:hypothetical protein
MDSGHILGRLWLDNLLFGRGLRDFLRFTSDITLGFTMQSLLIRFFVLMGFYFYLSLLVISINRH